MKTIRRIIYIGVMKATLDNEKPIIWATESIINDPKTRTQYIWSEIEIDIPVEEFPKAKPISVQLVPEPSA